MTDYTIKEGDNLSTIAKANNTTVDALVKANQIADPNKINAGAVLKLPTIDNTMNGADINASQIKGGAPNVEVPVTPTKTQTSANAISTYTDEQQKKIDAEQSKILSAIGGGATKTTAENLANLANTRETIDTAGKLKTELESTGATAISDQLQLENTKLGTLKGEVEVLDTKEQNEIDALEGSGMTRDAIDRQKTVIQRSYASQKALKNAEYSAQAAMVAALQGNYTIAKSAAEDAVNAYTYDYQQNVKTFDTLFSVYSDALKDLDEEEQEILKTAASNAQNELDKITTEKKEVSELMIDNPNAGVSLSDTLDQASKKVAEYEKKNPTVSSTVGSAETGYTMYDKYGNVIGTKAGTGNGDDGLKLTDSQIITGSQKAHMDIADFKNLSLDEQAWFLTGRYESALDSLSSDAMSRGIGDVMTVINNDTSIPTAVKNSLTKDIKASIEGGLQNQTIKLTPSSNSQYFVIYDTEKGSSSNIFGNKEEKKELQDMSAAAKALGYGQWYSGGGAERENLTAEIMNWIEEEQKKMKSDQAIAIELRGYLNDAKNGTVTADNPFIKY